MQKVADNLAEVPSGRLLLSDLQADGRNAFIKALRVKTEIHNQLHPYVKVKLA